MAAHCTPVGEVVEDSTSFYQKASTILSLHASKSTLNRDNGRFFTDQKSKPLKHREAEEVTVEVEAHCRRLVLKAVTSV